MPPRPRPPVVIAVTAAVLSRGLILGVGVLAVMLIGAPKDQRLPVRATEHVLADLPARWDTGWYVGLASGGYHWDGRAGHFENIAFFPAYPLLLGTVARGLGAKLEVTSNWVGVGLSTTLFAVALWLLWHSVRRLGDARQAGWAVLLCASYPFSLFFGLPYTESLFLVGLVATFLAFERRWYTAALLGGILVGSTRPTGALVSAALALLWYGQYSDALHPIPRRQLVASVAVVAGPLLGVAVYSAFIYGLTGDPLAWATVQEGWGRPSQSPFAALGGPLLRLATSPTHAVTAVPHETLNATAALGVLALSWPVGKRLGAGYGLMTFMGVAVPLAAGGVASVGRYSAVLFPLHMWLALAVPASRLPALAAGFAVLQAVVAGLFLTWRPMY